jgi:hypothetical protein
MSCHWARYLGARITDNLAFNEERSQRIMAVTRAWCTFGSFWSSSAPWRWKVALFKGYVLNVALSGLEAWAGRAGPLRTSELHVVEARQLRYVRALVRWCRGGQLDDNTPHVEIEATLSTAPLLVELQIRRLKLL